MSSLLVVLTPPLALLTIASQVILAISIVASIAWRFGFKPPLLRSIAHHAGAYGASAALFVALSAMVGSLILSDSVGLEPCTLCWYQRIFMYPIVFILALALLWRDQHAARYAQVLAGFGILISIYQYMLQFGGPQLVACGTDVAEACTRRYILAYGYITIPLMTATAFGLILTFLALARAFPHSQSTTTGSRPLVCPPERQEF